MTPNIKETNNIFIPGRSVRGNKKRSKEKRGGHKGARKGI